MCLWRKSKKEEPQFFDLQLCPFVEPAAVALRQAKRFLGPTLRPHDALDVASNPAGKFVLAGAVLLTHAI